mgnify:CR=1 FL=1
MTLMLDLPMQNAYWVLEGKFMAGETPGTSDELNTRARVKGLLRNGVKTWIDLTKVTDFGHDYEAILMEEAADYGLDVSRINYPITDFSNPSPVLMTRILDRIDSEIVKGKCIYVHCYAGIGRTGTVVGCYLVRHGLGGDEAITKIAQLRENVANWWHKSPETTEQAEFIRNWKVGQ